MAGGDGDNDAPQLESPLVWIDLEMTGLDPTRHVIVEAAVIITDGSMAQKIEGPDLVMTATDDQLAAMDDVVTEMHRRSGLTKRIQAAELTVPEAEERLLDFVKRHVPEPRTAPLAGNSVHADRAFLEAHMPELASHLHYRNVDVSTIKELAKRWYPDLGTFEKQTTHRALSDITESIAELEYYREVVFQPPPEPAGESD